MRGCPLGEVVLRAEAGSGSPSSGAAESAPGTRERGQGVPGGHDHRRPEGPGMTTAATRYLHLVRHGEATPDESGLTGNGRRQAALLGHRLRGVPFAAVHHGPLPRAEETARLIHAELADGIPLHRTESAGGYAPTSRAGTNSRRNRPTSSSASSKAPPPRSRSRAPPRPAGHWTGSPARSRVRAGRTVTSWSSPTTSWSPGSYGTPCAPPRGAGSASTTPTPP